jgi:hypothetical protein
VAVSGTGTGVVVLGAETGALLSGAVFELHPDSTAITAIAMSALTQSFHFIGLPCLTAGGATFA